MTAIKLQCDCGQRYAFDIEPINGRMPSAVACPACGIDGTPAANAYLAQAHAGSGDALPVAAPARLHIRKDTAPQTAPAVQVEAVAESNVPVARPTPPSKLPGQINRDQAVHEARAKILWGDTRKDVIKFLMIQGFTYDEALDQVREMSEERAATIRSNGIGKIVMGTGLVLVPIVAYFIFARIGVIPLKIFAVAIMVGLWGGWMLLKGSIMVMAPRSEPGDVGDH